MADFIIKNNSIDQVDQILTQRKFIKKPINGNQGAEYNAPDGGNINVYYKSGKVVIGGPQDKKELLTSLFQELFQEYLATEPQKPVARQNMVFKYTIPAIQMPILKNELEKFVRENHYNLQEGAEEQAHYRFIVSDSQKNKVTITQYKTSTLLIQGLESELWFEISNLIGNKLNITFQTVVAQIVAEPGEQIEVISIVTKNDRDEAESRIKARLGECYLFLYPHDRDAVEASQYMLDSGLQPKDYFGFVSGTIRSIEGFAKKLFIDIKAFKEGEIRKTGEDRWEFSKAYDRETEQLKPQVLNCLSSDPTIKKIQEERIKELIVEGVFRTRHPYFHDGPAPGVKVITNPADARSIHDKLIGIMIRVHECLKSELNK